MQINVNNKRDEHSSPASDIPVLFKIGSYFLRASEIRALVRFGKGTKIILSNEDEVLVDMNYDKVADLTGKR